ncbi:hypothetical protein BFJ63_vAg15461 [Fusarium oxysporum f. sp. narcissi]|uniref:Uncharacterized protein n=1 Tax=Fusarium oxysporum f. sp. narcissi TaxID=451672 RepID=A0A4Q2V4H1_FUSOX|nr:hypothetical protein BFJ63_vAg15461 [Fusarium oxysporum f. sp. narcissi]
MYAKATLPLASKSQILVIAKAPCQFWASNVATIPVQSQHQAAYSTRFDETVVDAGDIRMNGNTNTSANP